MYDRPFVSRSTRNSPHWTASWPNCPQVISCYRQHIAFVQTLPSSDVYHTLSNASTAIHSHLISHIPTYPVLSTALVMAEGGVAVFLTFHSGEDRRVKKHFKQGKSPCTHIITLTLIKKVSGQSPCIDLITLTLTDHTDTTTHHTYP